MGTPTLPTPAMTTGAIDRARTVLRHAETHHLGNNIAGISFYDTDTRVLIHTNPDHSVITALIDWGHSLNTETAKIDHSYQTFWLSLTGTIHTELSDDVNVSVDAVIMDNHIEYDTLHHAEISGELTLDQLAWLAANETQQDAQDVAS